MSLKGWLKEKFPNRFCSLEELLKKNNIPEVRVQNRPVGVVEDGIFYEHPLHRAFCFAEGDPEEMVVELENFHEYVRNDHWKWFVTSIAAGMVPAIIGVYAGVDVNTSGEVLHADLNPVYVVMGFTAGLLGMATSGIAGRSYYGIKNNCVSIAHALYENQGKCLERMKEYSQV